MAQRQIDIPERTADEPPASAEQLARIRELTTGLSLQGYRFDYRKLGHAQADAVLNQLNTMNDQQTPARKPAKQGPGCIASLAKGTTALIVWAVVLAGVAGGAYLIYWQINQAPDTAATNDENNPGHQASADNPSNTPRSTQESSIFEGLGVSGSPEGNPGKTPETDPGNTPATDTPAPKPDITPPTHPAPAVDRLLISQLSELEDMLVKLSQYTRNDFPADIRVQSSQAMNKKLEAYTKALSALDAVDPTISSRIRTAIDAFAADPFDGQALRDDIKTIRESIDKLK